MSEKEHRGFGPPGTGKTFWLANQIDRAIRKFDGVQNVCVASFTKTAAREISQRVGIRPSNMFGTLHSICFGLLGNPIIAEGETKRWNEWIEAKGMPTFVLSVEGSKTDDPEWSASNEYGSAGDVAFMQLQNLRARMLPRNMWPATVRAFEQLWTDWKIEVSARDFTDLIDICLQDKVRLPAQVRCAFFDEVQDFTKLELELVRMWGQALEYSILVGDDDQCIFSFKGATPDAFLFPKIDESQKTILSQSYRVPIAVHALANKWIRNVKARQEKEYKPTDVQGAVVPMSVATWKHPELMIKSVEKQLDAGHSIMILATCSYHLGPTIRLLRTHGLPFHNPYRRKRGDWNPLVRRKSGTASADRMLAYLQTSQAVFGDAAESWNNQSLALWIEHIKSDGLLVRGAKKKIEALAKDDPDGLPPLLELFTSEAAEILWDDPNVDWFVSKIQANKQSVYEYPCNILKARGAKALIDEPKITVGTIHSVKGGEADAVYVFPDLSTNGLREWQGELTRDPIIRLFYVAFTRARKELHLCVRATSCAVQWSW
jgi:superfamily I DNA/RNA helicase